MQCPQGGSEIIISTRSASLPSARYSFFVLLLSSIIGLTVAAPAAASTTENGALVELGSATSFAVLAYSGITNTGATTVSGTNRADMGSSPTVAFTGHGLVTMTNGTKYLAAHETVQQAKIDLATAYADAASRTGTTHGVELGGKTLTPGVYSGGTFGITGELTLDAEDDPSAVFIFQAGSTLVTATGSKVTLINGAQAANVFWQVGSSATFGTTTDFSGTVLAHTSITAVTGATFKGQLLALGGAVTLDTNSIVNDSSIPAEEVTEEEETEENNETGTDADGSGSNADGDDDIGGSDGDNSGSDDSAGSDTDETVIGDDDGEASEDSGSDEADNSNGANDDGSENDDAENESTETEAPPSGNSDDTSGSPAIAGPDVNEGRTPSLSAGAQQEITIPFVALASETIPNNLFRSLAEETDTTTNSNGEPSVGFSFEPRPELAAMLAGAVTRIPSLQTDSTFEEAVFFDSTSEVTTNASIGSRIKSLFQSFLDSGVNVWNNLWTNVQATFATAGR